MGVGKYSPLCPHANTPGWDMFRFNCYGETPVEWSKAISDAGVAYDEKTMFDNYDDEGFMMEEDNSPVVMSFVYDSLSRAV